MGGNVLITTTDPDGEEIAIAVEIRVTDVDEAPVFRSSTSSPARVFNVEFNVEERLPTLYTGADFDSPADPAAYTFFATDPEDADTPIIWSLEGTDSAGFTIPGGVLTAPATLEYVRNGDNVYELTVVAADSPYDDAKKARLSVTVKVIDDDEMQQDGEIEIFNRQPEVGINLFLDGPLSDDDGVIGTPQWQWYARDGCPHRRL